MHGSLCPARRCKKSTEEDLAVACPCFVEECSFVDKTSERKRELRVAAAAAPGTKSGVCSAPRKHEKQENLAAQAKENKVMLSHCCDLPLPAFLPSNLVVVPVLSTSSACQSLLRLFRSLTACKSSTFKERTAGDNSRTSQHLQGHGADACRSFSRICVMEAGLAHIKGAYCLRFLHSVKRNR
jgi:hypothetical protein